MSLIEELGGYESANEVIKNLGATPVFGKYLIIVDGVFKGFINSKGINNPHIKTTY